MKSYRSDNRNPEISNCEQVGDSVYKRNYVLRGEAKTRERKTNMRAKIQDSAQNSGR